MHRLMRSRYARSLTVPAAVGLVAATAVAASATAASAGTSLTIVYPVHGSTHLKAPNATVALGPGTLRSTVNLGTGKLTASLTLPTATVSFKEFGLIPVSGKTEFLQDGATTGKIDLNNGAVTTTSHITLKIVSMSLAGVPLPVGSKCESATPAAITLKSQPGFSVVSGGKLTGTYTVPPFAHCGPLGLLTPVINTSITGPGNTITFTLSAGKAV
jgi:hypothetical protein